MYIYAKCVILGNDSFLYLFISSNSMNIEWIFVTFAFIFNCFRSITVRKNQIEHKKCALLFVSFYKFLHGLFLKTSVWLIPFDVILMRWSNEKKNDWSTLSYIFFQMKIFCLLKSTKKTNKFSFFLNLIAVSPTLPGTVPTTVLPQLNAEFNPLQTVASNHSPIMTHTATHSTATILPPQQAAAVRSANGPYLPPFHPFSHPSEFLCKNPFLPYDFTSLRGITSVRPMHHIQQSASIVTDSSTISSQTPEHLSTSRLSPASSRPSSSSPPSSQHSITITIKHNESVDVAESDDSDDEQIDVVKSAFVPILRPNPSAHSIVGIADSTTINDQMDSSPTRTRCDLKAPSSRKPVHETAPVGPRSPETKIKSPISTQKTVWRPY